MLIETFPRRCVSSMLKLSHVAKPHLVLRCMASCLCLHQTSTRHVQPWHHDCCHRNHMNKLVCHACVQEVPLSVQSVTLSQQILLMIGSCLTTLLPCRQFHRQQHPPQAPMLPLLLPFHRLPSAPPSQLALRWALPISLLPLVLPFQGTPK